MKISCQQHAVYSTTTREAFVNMQSPLVVNVSLKQGSGSQAQPTFLTWHDGHSDLTARSHPNP